MVSSAAVVGEAWGAPEFESPAGHSATHEVLQVVQAPGDGDCMFHSLGHLDRQPGSALRTELVRFMRAHAHEQDGFRAERIRLH